ncbi:hypothetical protein SPHV1_180021 [Novosphingobium sp. KN65.2]|nr:hypothetical protein SPHV1_180021 [Novosphingobium sp. KN65.2]
MALLDENIPRIMAMTASFPADRELALAFSDNRNQGWKANVQT